MNIVRRVLDTDSLRTPTLEKTLKRVAKLFEEGGELAEAILYSNATHETNKKKIREDVLEEAIDVAIMAIVIALSAYPALNDDEMIEEVHKMFEKKLEKWKIKKDRGTAVV